MGENIKGEKPPSASRGGAAGLWAEPCPPRGKRGRAGDTQDLLSAYAELHFLL